MMRRQFNREASVAANWAVMPALFSLVLGVLATLAHRFGFLASPDFVNVALVTLALALCGFVLALAGAYAFWNYGYTGIKKSIFAFFLSMPVLLTAMFVLFLASTTAPLTDIATDTDAPPQFSTNGVNGNTKQAFVPSGIDATIQKSFYPNVLGRRYVLDADAIVAQVMQQMVDNGWDLKSDKGLALSDSEWLIEATVKTAIFGFTDHVVLRVTNEGNATFVDMRSASAFGQYDLGANAKRIVQFMDQLDTRISLQGQ